MNVQANQSLLFFQFVCSDVYLERARIEILFHRVVLQLHLLWKPITVCALSLEINPFYSWCTACMGTISWLGSSIPSGGAARQLTSKKGPVLSLCIDFVYAWSLQISRKKGSFLCSRFWKKGCFHELVLEIEKGVFLSLYSKLKRGWGFFFWSLGSLCAILCFWLRRELKVEKLKNTPVSTRFASG